MSEIAAGVFGFDVRLQFLRLRKVFAADVALRSTAIRIGRTAVCPMHVQISRSQKALPFKINKNVKIINTRKVNRE